MNRLLKIFETKTASVICLLVALASRIVNVLYVSYTGRDKMILVMQSKSFLQGKGFIIPQYLVDNLQKPVYDKTPYWPPGYPLFLSPFLKLFNYHIYNATSALDILVCIALIFVVRALVKQIGFPAAAINIITLVIGCFEYSFISESLPTDTISLLFLLMAVSYCIRVLKGAPVPFSGVVFCGFLLFLPNFFRYAYPAASVAVPLVIIITGMLLKQKALLKKGVVILSSVLFFLAVFIIYMKSSAGSAGYALQTTRGFFPGNLIHWQPVVPASFINIPFLSSQLLIRFGISLRALISFLEIINVAGVILFVSWFMHQLRKKKFTPLNSYKWFLLTGFSISATIFITLGYLSLTYASQVSPGRIWNYITESRYFAFVFVFIQLVFVSLLFKQGWKKPVLLKFMLLVPAIFLLLEITHNIYFNTKVALAFEEYKPTVYREQDYRYMINLISETESTQPGMAIITAGYKDDYFGYIGTYTGHIGIADPITLNDHLPKVKKKTILYLMLYDADLDQFRPFLKNNTVTRVKQLDYSAFYSLELDP